VPASALLQRIEASLPAEFDAEVYRHLHPDLTQKNDAQLRRHFREYGIKEGRCATRLGSATEFAQLVPGDADALEIGAFYKPYLRGERVRHFDILHRDALVERARALGFPHERIPSIDYIDPHGDLRCVTQSFDVVLSSHVVEHQPDLVRHLHGVENILRPGGLYFLLVPDHRYCFDHFIAESTIAEVLDAHVSGRRVHSLRSRLEHAALRTHNDPKRHWRGDHGSLEGIPAALDGELAVYQAQPGAFVDVHAWYFTPSSFSTVVTQLAELGLTRLRQLRLYPTLHSTNEFWAVLQLPA
jgi:SAM-dependent methyltransferase